MIVRRTGLEGALLHLAGLLLDATLDHRLLLRLERQDVHLLQLRVDRLRNRVDRDPGDRGQAPLAAACAAREQREADALDLALLGQGHAGLVGAGKLRVAGVALALGAALTRVAERSLVVGSLRPRQAVEPSADEAGSS